MNSPTSPLLSLYLAQFLFGVLYASLIHWLSMKHYLPGSTAWSVVIGDAATLFIQWLFVRDGWNFGMTFGSFACSGFPMVITYLYRHQSNVIRARHTRRPWPTAAAKARDDAVMELAMMADEIANEKATVVSIVHRLHKLIGLLNSV